MTIRQLRRKTVLQEIHCKRIQSIRHLVFFYFVLYVFSFTNSLFCLKIANETCDVVRMMKSKVFEIITVLFSIMNYIQCYGWPPLAPALNCTDLNPQRSVNLEEVREVFGR